MTVYLYSDVFEKFKKFFNVDTFQESRFLYEIAYGFMPRQFELTEEDCLIYDEEEEVSEMYFFTEGTLGIGFSLVANGISKDQKHISKRLQCPQHICDHYVLSNCKSRFIYVAYLKEVRGFALTKKFLQDDIKPKYPEIFNRIKNECLKNYKKNIFKPINDDREIKIQMINK